MALTTRAMSGAIYGAAQSRYPGSQVTPGLALAVARAVVSWISSATNVAVTGVTAGSAGVGSVNGKLTFSGAPRLVSFALQSAGVVGPTSTGVGLVVGAGVLSTLNASAQYSGSSSGVGVGSDTSKVANANPATLIPLLISNLSSQRIAGISSRPFAIGLANGISQIVLTGTGFGGVVGTASPVGATGSSVSVVF